MKTKDSLLRPPASGKFLRLRSSRRAMHESGLLWPDRVVRASRSLWRGHSLAVLRTGYARARERDAPATTGETPVPPRTGTLPSADCVLTCESIISPHSQGGVPHASAPGRRVGWSGLDPNNPQLHYSLAYWLEKQGDRDEALGEYRIAYTLSPENSQFKRAFERLARKPKANRASGVPKPGGGYMRQGHRSWLPLCSIRAASTTPMRTLHPQDWRSFKSASRNPARVVR